MISLRDVPRMPRTMIRAFKRRFARMDSWIAARFPSAWLTRAYQWIAFGIGCSLFALVYGTQRPVTRESIDVTWGFPEVFAVATTTLFGFFMWGVSNAVSVGKLRRPFKERLTVFTTILATMMCATAAPMVLAYTLLPRVAALETPEAIAALVTTHQRNEFWLCAPDTTTLHDRLNPRLETVLADVRRYGFKSEGRGRPATEEECETVGRRHSPASVSLQLAAADATSSPPSDALLSFKRRVLYVDHAHAFRDGRGLHAHWALQHSWRLLLLDVTLAAAGMVVIWVRERRVMIRMAHGFRDRLDQKPSAWSSRIDRFVAARFFVVWSARLPAMAPTLAACAALSILARGVPEIVMIAMGVSAASILANQREAHGLSADLRTELGALAFQSLVVVSMAALVFAIDTRLSGSTPIWPYVLLIGSFVCAIVPALRVGSRRDTFITCVWLSFFTMFVAVLTQGQQRRWATIWLLEIALAVAALFAFETWLARFAPSARNIRGPVLITPLAMAFIGVLLLMALVSPADFSTVTAPRYLCLASAVVLISTAAGIAIYTPLRRFRVGKP